LIINIGQHSQRKKVNKLLRIKLNNSIDKDKENAWRALNRIGKYTLEEMTEISNFLLKILNHERYTKFKSPHQ